LLTLSGACLFLGIAETLPTEISLIGLKLTANTDAVGWFLVVISIYLLVHFMVYGYLEIYKSYLPYQISNKSKDVTGNTIGLTESEIYNENRDQFDQYQPGTTSQELEDIQENKKFISNTYKRKYRLISNRLMLLLEIIFPVIFSIISVAWLVKYLLKI